MASSAPQDVDRGIHLAATYIAGCVISFLFVASRLMARWSIAGVGWDDISMLTTWIVFVPVTTLICVFSLDGGTRHLQFLLQDPEKMVFVLKMNWIAQPLAIFCLGSGKVAIALLILRLLSRASVYRRWSLYVTIGWTTINTILMIVFTFSQCSNPAALWDAEVRARSTCYDPHVQSSVSLYGAAVHALIDFYLAVIPVSLVWRLHTDLRRRIALCALLGCGSITGICASIKATKLSALNARSDLTWETFSLWLWTGIEIILLMICGSIPALKPIYAICMGRRPLTIRSNQPYASGSKGPASRRSYARHMDQSQQIEEEGSRQRSEAMVTSLEDDDDVVEMQATSDKGMGGIQVTKTITINK